MMRQANLKTHVDRDRASYLCSCCSVIVRYQHRDSSPLCTQCVPFAGKTSVFLGDASRASVGDEVSYTFVVTNEGTTTLSDAVISDTKVRIISASVRAPINDDYIF